MTALKLTAFALSLFRRYIRDCPVNNDSYNAARVAAGTAARVAVAVATREVLNGAAIGENGGSTTGTSIGLVLVLHGTAIVLP